MIYILEDDVVTGLDAGADDYVTKPFGMMALVSRIKAILRRYEKSDTKKEILEIGGIKLDESQHTVFAGNQQLFLTVKEFDLLLLLMKNRGNVLTMAANGALSWELSAAIVLGSNIGSTVDAVMSSFGASVNARRTALVHVAFNVTGTVLALLVFKPFLNLIDFIVPMEPAQNITTHIAMLHTIFNICATLVFLLFVNQIAVVARKIIPETQSEKDEHYHLPAILPHTRISADLYSFQIQKEITKMCSSSKRKSR